MRSLLVLVMNYKDVWSQILGVTYMKKSFFTWSKTSRKKIVELVHVIL